VTGGDLGDFKEQVRAQTDLVALVGESISLTARSGGREHVGLCPFHDDHNPSMVVYPDRQTYRCWVCDSGGDCFSWVMNIDGVGFVDAVEHLAERVNLEMPRRRRPDAIARDAKSRLYEVLKWAEEQFHRCLLEDSQSARCRDYLADQRRIGPEMIARFRIGFHPPSWDWIQQRARGRFTAADLEAAGLVKQRQDGSGLRDDFVDRVLFPIHDLQDRTVGFGGRILPDHRYADAPKYLNSGENPVFSKKTLLYGLATSRKAIQAKKSAIVVEGYTDCVTAHQFGVTHVVGTLGTSLTDEHVTVLKRFTDRVVLVYDGDQAGQAAAERALPRFLAQDVDLRVLTLPEGLDPAEFLERHGEGAFAELADGAPEALDFKWQSAQSRIGTATVDARRKLLEEMIELVAAAPRLVNTAREAVILGMVSQKLGMAETDLRSELARRRRVLENQRTVQRQRIDRVEDEHGGLPAPVVSAATTRHEHAERAVIEILVSAPEKIETIRNAVRVAEIRDRYLRELLDVFYEIHDNGGVPTFDRVAARIEREELKRLLVKIDEEARTKNTSALLNESDVNLVDEVIGVLKWRNEQEKFETERAAREGREDTGGGLDEEQKARLLRGFEHHKERTRQGVIR